MSAGTFNTPTCLSCNTGRLSAQSQIAPTRFSSGSQTTTLRGGTRFTDTRVSPNRSIYNTPYKGGTPGGVQGVPASYRNIPVKNPPGFRLGSTPKSPSPITTPPAEPIVTSPAPSPGLPLRSIGTAAGIGAGLSGGVDIARRLSEGQSVPQAIAGGTATGIGTAAGTFAGGTLGTAAGPIGTAIGMGLGGLLGGLLGSAIGDLITGANRLNPRRQRDKAVPPNYGNQKPGERYDFQNYVIVGYSDSSNNVPDSIPCKGFAFVPNNNCEEKYALHVYNTVPYNYSGYFTCLAPGKASVSPYQGQTPVPVPTPAPTPRSVPAVAPPLIYTPGLTPKSIPGGKPTGAPKTEGVPTPLMPQPSPTPQRVQPGQEPQKDPRQENNPLSPLIPAVPFIPPLVTPAPSSSTSSNRPPGAEPQPPGRGVPIQPPADGPCSSGCGAVLSKRLDAIEQTLKGAAGTGGNALNAGLQGLSLGQQQELLNLVKQIDQKVGPQIPNGGIAGFIKKTWNFLQIDRALNVLTWIGVVHNAYMLSSNIGQTLFSAISNGLAVAGLKDDEDNPLDISEIVGKWTDNLFKGLFGVETWNGIKTTWKKLNRIISSATALLQSIQSIGYSILQSLEVVGQWVAQIGNAVRKYGVVWEKAFNWMNPNINFTQNRFFNALNKTQDAVEGVDEITSELLSVSETSAELAKQVSDLDKALKGKDAEGNSLDKPTPAEHTKTKDDEDANKSSSQGATINAGDEKKPES